MAQAAPSPGGASRPGPRPAIGERASGQRTRPPDVFDTRTHRMARLAVPVVAGLVYGYWASTNRRYGGPLTAWNIAFGFITAAVFAVLCAGLLMLAPRTPRELRALLWAAFVGTAFGFLCAQSTKPFWETLLISIFMAAGTYIVFFYRYYTREDAFGRRVR